MPKPANFLNDIGKNTVIRDGLKKSHSNKLKHAAKDLMKRFLEIKLSHIALKVLLSHYRNVINVKILSNHPRPDGVTPSKIKPLASLWQVQRVAKIATYRGGQGDGNILR